MATGAPKDTMVGSWQQINSTTAKGAIEDEDSSMTTTGAEAPMAPARKEVSTCVSVNEDSLTATGAVAEAPMASESKNDSSSATGENKSVWWPHEEKKNPCLPQEE